MRFMKRRIKLSIIIIIMLVVLPVSVFAKSPNISVKAEVDTTRGRVGDLFNLNVIISADSSLTIAPPSTKEGFGDFAVLGTKEPIVRDSDNVKIYKLGYRISAYKTGELYIPPITITASDSVGKQFTAQTDSIGIKIVSVLPNKQADSLTIKSIKPIMEFPYPLYYYFIGAAILIIIALLIWLYIRRKRRKKLGPRKTEKPLEPPWVVALRMLEELKDERLLEKGEFKRFYFGLSEVAKYYIDKRFGLPAIEKTTAEIRERLLKSKPPEIDDNFIEFLEYADLVKFAKHPSTISEGEKWIAYIEGLIRSTKPQVQVVASEKTVEVGG